MKRFSLVLCMVVAFAGYASAQVPGPVPAFPVSIYASGAISIPASPSGFKDGFKTGLHGSLGIGLNLSPAFQIVGKVETHQFKVDFDNNLFLSAIAGIDGGKNKIWMYGVDGRYSIGVPGAPIKPFLLVGGGLAKVSQTDFSSTDPLATSLLNSVLPASQTNVYFNIGGGIDLKSSPAFAFFAQVRYVTIATAGSSSSFIPLSLGVRFF